MALIIESLQLSARDKMTVSGHVESFTLRSAFKRTEYQDQAEAELIITPMGLPFHHVVDHVAEKVKLGQGTLEILAEVVRATHRRLDITVKAVMDERLKEAQLDLRARADRIQERRYDPKPTTSDTEL